MHRLTGGLLSLLAALAPPALSAASVDASQYQAFWLWSGVRPQPVLAQARCLYILQAQIGPLRYSRDATAHFIAQRAAMPKLATKQAQIWLSYRAQTLDWNEPVYATLLAQLQRWERSGNPLHGIQIDFDVRTRALNDYVVFLRDLRHRLPQRYRLSITGLLDWSANADPQVINQLQGVVDEVVIQTYQGRHSISNYSAYMGQISRLQLPFKIGLAQYSEWQAPPQLEQAAGFRGYVVFLQNP